jgi:hypothetical protein
MMNYLINGPLLVILPGSAMAAAIGRSFRSGLRACAWAAVLTAPLLIAAWLAEGLRWDQVGRGLVLDGAGRWGWAPTWAMRPGGPWCSWCCGPCPSACSARPPVVP